MLRPGRAADERGVSPAVRLRALIAWQAVVAAAVALLVVGAVVAGRLPEGRIVRGGAIAVLAALGLASLAAAPLLARRRHLGRTLALSVDYLGFLGCAVALLHRNRVFVGLDALGSTFARGVPFLVVMVAGYLLAGFRDRPERPGPYRRAGRILMAVGGVGLLLAVGLVQGLATFAARTADPAGLALAAGAVAFAAAARAAWRDDVAAELGATRRSSEALNGFLLVSPNLLGFLVFFAGPLLFSLWVSLNDWDAFGPKVFIGLDNYVEILSLDVARGGAPLQEGYRPLFSVLGFELGARDVLFWTSMRNILWFSVLAVPLAVVPALFLATLLNANVPGIRAFRALYFVPTVAGVVGVTLIWKQLFNATVGYLNYGIQRVAGWLDALPGVDLGRPEPQWLSDSDLALYSLVIVFAWQYIGYNTILFTAGLQAVPADLYEAAHIDGASRWQRFRNITVPMLAPTTFFVVITTGILALQLFSESVILFSNFTPPGSGPNNAGLTPVGYLYQEGFQRFSQGYASAVAWVLFLVIFAFTFVQFQRQRAQAEG